MTFLCFFSPHPRVPKDEIKTTDTPEVMKEEDWRTKTVKFTLAKIMDPKEHPTGQQKSNLRSSSSTTNSSSKDETSMEILPLVFMPDYYHQLKGLTDNILYFPPCAESSRLSEMANEITAPKKYSMTFDERIATTMMQDSCADDTAEQKLSIQATATTKILSLLNTALRQIMLVHVIHDDDEKSVESGGAAATTTITMDYSSIMTEYVDIAHNVRELSNTNNDAIAAKVTELVSRAYRLIQITPRITNETNTVIETLNTMLLDNITEDHDDDNNSSGSRTSKTNEHEIVVDLVDYSAFLSKYISIANEAERARVQGDEVRGRELLVQAFQANKTLLA